MKGRVDPRAAHGAALATALVAVAALSHPLVASARARAVVPRSFAPHQLTPRQLAEDLRHSQRTTVLPVDLQPPLSQARSASPGISTNGCRLGRAGAWKKPCVYGDLTSRTRVVLFGDSHAAMWFPALNLISKQQHWRLIDLTKSGCPPAEVGIAAWFLGGAQYSACSRWRAEAMAYIASLRPALVVITWARWLEEPEGLPMPGVPTGHGSAWLDGVAAAFGFLRRAARRVVFVSDIPTLPESAPLCLAQHLADVRACDPTPRAATALATVKAQELQLASRERVRSIDPTSWFCTLTRCPVVVGDLLVYQDNSHMTRQWAQFIAPVLADSILPVMRRA